MKKFQLNLDELKVDSFEIAKTESKTGTVKGFRPPRTEDEICTIEDPTRPPLYYTCDYSCGGTCNGVPTCEDTCQASCLGTCGIQCNF